MIFHPSILSPQSFQPTLARPSLDVTPRPGVNGGFVDPLAGLTFALRVQSHMGKVIGTRDAIRVTGAGSPDVNKLYVQENATTWRSIDGSFFTWGNSGAGPWYLNAPGLGRYIQTSPNYNGGVPAGPWQLASNGVLPLPTLELVKIPVHAPAYTYADPGFTSAAAIDQQFGGWKWPGKPGLTESTLTNQPTLRMVNGVPVADFASNKRLAGPSGLFPLTGFAISLLAYLNPSASASYMLAGANSGAGIGGFFVGMLGSGKRFSVTLNRLSGAGGANAPENHPLGWQVVTATYNGSQCQCFVAGEGGAAANAGAYVESLNPFYLSLTSQGGWNNANTSYIAAMIYNPADRLAVEAYLETLKPAA